MPETPIGYELRPGTPTVDDYMRLRADSGLTPRTQEQAVLALPGSWAACHAVESTTGETVGMGRLIGDGGWYFHVVDMAVLPPHQRRGIGNWVLTWLFDQIRQAVPPDAFVSLMADPPGRRLYASHGFTERRDLSIGMAMWLDREDGSTEGYSRRAEAPLRAAARCALCCRVGAAMRSLGPVVRKPGDSRRETFAEVVDSLPAEASGGGQPIPVLNLAQESEFTDERGIRWRRRGEILLEIKALQRLLLKDEVKVLHDYMGEVKDVPHEARAAFWDQAQRLMASSPHSRFYGAEFKNAEREHLLVVHEDC